MQYFLLPSQHGEGAGLRSAGSPLRRQGAAASLPPGDRASPRVGGGWRGENVKTHLVEKVTLKTSIRNIFIAVKSLSP